MSITSRSMVAGTTEERGSAFIESLSDATMLKERAGEVDVYRRYLGLRTRKNSVFNIIEMVKSGLPLSAGENLARHMGVEPKTFFTLYVGMSDSTVRRRFKDRKDLSVDESDRVVRFAHLLYLATQLMEGSEDNARAWLSAPSPALGGATPLDTATTEAGARRVEDLIVSLEYGMFS